MSLPLPVILALLVLTLALAVWGIGDLVIGWGQRSRLVARSAMVTDEKVTGLLGRLELIIRRTAMGKTLARRLAASGMRIRVSTFVLLMSATGAFAIFLIGKWMAPLFGIAAAIGVGFAFLSYVRRREERRKEEFIAQLPELARVLSNATHAGLVMRTAIEIAADELADPAGEELRRTADALRLGQSVDEALHDLGERLPSRELGVLISTLLVSARAGGSLVTALRTIATTLEERKEIRREVKTIMGEAVVTNWAIGLLGIAGLAMVNVIMPDSLRIMSGKPVGQIILAVAGGLFIASLVIISRMTRIDV
ncbi:MULTISPECIES: type II secretion system F family protein [Actinomadura]|uniref:Tight adherence protein B n=1 Tax=Actinomadura madurae TaxID=1993 RepID=A0A1I5D960_9ACTN|nr:type II secretion system F family protein [Actinomadura madurae]SFN95789.1 tight adherence protein B [Actinomadura madurae]SPT50415.1 Flp pilus assembly protein TadB [Actinomadura madurae]